MATSFSQLHNYCAEHPENVYFRDFVSFSQRGELFTLGDNKRADNYLGTGGWMYNSPIYDSIMEKWGFSDFYSSIQNGNMYYLVNETRYKRVMNRINKFFESKMIKAKVEVADSFDTQNETVYVLKFISTEK